MKPKTARRWIKRNQWKMAMHRQKINTQGAAFVRRWKECEKALKAEKET